VGITKDKPDLLQILSSEDIPITEFVDSFLAPYQPKSFQSFIYQRRTAYLFLRYLGKQLIDILPSDWIPTKMIQQ